MRYEFERTSETTFAVVLHDQLPLMRRALSDSLNSRPPKGARQDGPSTYWIDEALKDLMASIQDGSERPFAAGNITYLRLKNGQVEARLDVDPEDSDSVDRVAATDFVALLQVWRERMLVESPGADSRVPPNDTLPVTPQRRGSHGSSND